MEHLSGYPTGTITFLFTDIEGYSTLEDRYGPLLQPVLDAHNQMLRELAAMHHGIEIRIVGDAFFLVFDVASNAIKFAVAAQQALREFSWKSTFPVSAEEVDEVRVRMGMHTGEARTLIHPGGQFDYFGTAVNRAARVSSAGHGGQILVSEATRLLSQGLLPSDIRFQDMGLHRLKGVGEERLWQVTAPGLLDEFRPVNTMTARRHNLPLPLTPFLGREKEWQECKATLLEPETRLLTITGFGGMGKTRLAQRIAEECYDDFADGVWWVPLENAVTGDDMVQRIAEQLVKNLKPQPSVREQLWNFYRDRELLLVLDNLEQIPPSEVAQVLIGLLNAGSRVKILATSRRSLEIAPERVVELEPFAASEAESLFIERARARKASFVPSESNMADIEAICDRLEGVPLAIEIAASRVALLSPKQILQRLDDQFKLLVARDPSLPSRHAALRAAVEWSHHLLSNDAKVLFARLSVFADGFTVDAAEAVAQNADVSLDVLDCLMELRNQSLLRRLGSQDSGEERLAMLESVREYAAEKLTGDETHRRHAGYYCTWACEQTGLLRTGEEAFAVESMETESDNLRAALHWSARNDAVLCARLALALHHYLYLRGHWEETNANLQKSWETLATVEGNGELLRLRAELRYQQAGLLQDIGEMARAIELAHESLERYREAGDACGAANTLNLLAGLAAAEKDHAAGRRYCNESLELWPENDFAGRGKTLHNLGRIEQGSGNLQEARRIYEEVLPLRRRSGDERGLAMTLSNLGMIAQQEDNYAEARDLYAQSLSIWRKLAQPPHIAILLNNIGDLELQENHSEKAMVFFIHARRIFTQLKSPYVAEVDSSLTQLKETLGEANYIRLYREAEEKAWENLV